jgi:hypothetical protein
MELILLCPDFTGDELAEESNYSRTGLRITEDDRSGSCSILLDCNVPSCERTTVPVDSGMRKLLSDDFGPFVGYRMKSALVVRIAGSMKDARIHRAELSRQIL